MEKTSNNPWAGHMSSNNPSQHPRYNNAHSDMPADMPPPYSAVSQSDATSRHQIDEKNASIDSRSSSSSNEDEILDQALEFTRHAPPTYARNGRLVRPVAIPQVASGLGMPFSRGYANALQDRGVSMDEFVEFVDNLNIVSSSSPPLQILDAAAGLVGMVPLQTAQIAAASIQAAAKIGNIAVSKTRGAVFLKKANTDFFNPRGLKMELVTGDALKARLGMNAEAPLAYPLELSGDMTLHERRMAALHGFVAPVTFDVPPPNEPSNVLNKMSAGAQKRNIAKQEAKALKSREKYMEESDKANRDLNRESSKADREFDKISSKIEKERAKRDRELLKIQEKAERELTRKPKDANKIERERNRDSEKTEHEFERELKKLTKDQDKLSRELEKEKKKTHKDVMNEDKEGKAAKKIQWILIEDL